MDGGENGRSCRRCLPGWDVFHLGFWELGAGGFEAAAPKIGCDLNRLEIDRVKPVLTINLYSMYLGPLEVCFGTIMQSNHVVGRIGSILEWLWFFFDAAWESRYRCGWP
jgi:hypothetical protein